jgi:hypothetical protein
METLIYFPKQTISLKKINWAWQLSKTYFQSSKHLWNSEKYFLTDWDNKNATG